MILHIKPHGSYTFQRKKKVQGPFIYHFIQYMLYSPHYCDDCLKHKEKTRLEKHLFFSDKYGLHGCFQLGRKKAAQETEETLTKCGMENKYQRRRTLALMKHQLYDSVITVMYEGLLTLLFFSLFFLIQHKVGWIHIITNEMFGRFQAEIAQPDTQLNFLLSPNITSAWQNIDLKTSNIIMNWHEDICRLYLHGVKGMNTSKGHFLNNFKQEYENQKKKIVREIQETCNDC